MVASVGLLKLVLSRQLVNMDVALLKRSISEKTRKKTQETTKISKNRFLITVNVQGSSGPIRFVVGEDDSVAVVIDAALKLYRREKRLPKLGSDANGFLLYPANAGLDALSPSDLIGCVGMIRNFILCKKDGLPDIVRSNGWKAWLNKSIFFIKASLINLTSH